MLLPSALCSASSARRPFSWSWTTSSIRREQHHFYRFIPQPVCELHVGPSFWHGFQLAWQYSYLMLSLRWGGRFRQCMGKTGKRERGRLFNRSGRRGKLVKGRKMTVWWKSRCWCQPNTNTRVQLLLGSSADEQRIARRWIRKILVAIVFTSHSNDWEDKLHDVSGDTVTHILPVEQGSQGIPNWTIGSKKRGAQLVCLLLSFADSCIITCTVNLNQFHPIVLHIAFLLLVVVWNVVSTTGRLCLLLSHRIFSPFSISSPSPLQAMLLAFAKSLFNDATFLFHHSSSPSIRPVASLLSPFVPGFLFADSLLLFNCYHSPSRSLFPFSDPFVCNRHQLTCLAWLIGDDLLHEWGFSLSVSVCLCGQGSCCFSSFLFLFCESTGSM
jgi:hypothetical protein